LISNNLECNLNHKSPGVGYHLFQVLYRTAENKKIKSKTIPAGHYQQKIIRTMTNNSSCGRIGRVIYKSPLKDSLNQAVFTAVKKECTALSSRKTPSALRDSDSQHLATLSLEKLDVELKEKAPLMHGVIQQTVRGSILGTVVTAAVALKFHNSQLSALHHVVAQILDKGGATDEVYTTLFD
jgi:hypothetical protein